MFSLSCIPIVKIKQIILQVFRVIDIYFTYYILHVFRACEIYLKYMLHM